ncbi:MAG: Tn3 family transposase, partial [Chitinophagaceae bacterium]
FVDNAFPENSSAEIIKGKLVLRKPEKSPLSQALKELDKKITASLPENSIVDVLTDTEKWVQLHKGFGPLSESKGRLDEPEMRFITTLFCYGCNLGPSQTAKSVKGLTRKQVAWLNLKNATEDRIDKAIFKVTNAYNKFQLPCYWGTGKYASVDGTIWKLYEQNLVSEYHIRYGAYGGIGYYLVSDKYIALFSHFIPCGVYEGNNLIDLLVDNESDIQPDVIHGDTHAQNYPVFALTYLLGIQLMPRIRGIGNLSFAKSDKKQTYKNINSLFTESIDW